MVSLYTGIRARDADPPTALRMHLQTRAGDLSEHDSEPFCRCSLPTGPDSWTYRRVNHRLPRQIRQSQAQTAQGLVRGSPDPTL